MSVLIDALVAVGQTEGGGQDAGRATPEMIAAISQWNQDAQTALSAFQGLSPRVRGRGSAIQAMQALVSGPSLLGDALSLTDPAAALQASTQAASSSTPTTSSPTSWTGRSRDRERRPTVARRARAARRPRRCGRAPGAVAAHRAADRRCGCAARRPAPPAAARRGARTGDGLRGGAQGEGSRRRRPPQSGGGGGGGGGPPPSTPCAPGTTQCNFSSPVVCCYGGDSCCQCGSSTLRCIYSDCRCCP